MADSPGPPRSPNHAGSSADSDFDQRLVVYHAFVRRDFLAAILFPRATPQAIEINSSPEDLLERLPAGCDHALFQINLSLTANFPTRRGELLDGLRERGVTVINATLDDIRKSTLHQRLQELDLPMAGTGPEGDPDDYVMVKTDLNYGGSYERGLSSEDRKNLGIAEHVAPIVSPNQYQRMRRRDVPEGWWHEPTLLIERYIENPQGRFFRAYRVGNHAIIVESRHPGVIKKIHGGLDETNYTATLARLREIDQDGLLPLALVRVVEKFLSHSGLEFGSIDIMDDGGGGFYIVDINDTPYGGSVASSEAAAHLSRGFGGGEALEKRP